MLQSRSNPDDIKILCSSGKESIARREDSAYWLSRARFHAPADSGLWAGIAQYDRIDGSAYWFHGPKERPDELEDSRNDTLTPAVQLHSPPERVQQYAAADQSQPRLQPHPHPPVAVSRGHCSRLRTAAEHRLPDSRGSHQGALDRGGRHR